METSRDDFIIAIRSAFLKKGTQQRFSLLSLIFFCIIFLILGSLNFKVINYIKIGINEVVEKFGVKPNKVIQIQALTGDKIDNIPGAPGIGPKTALELIKQFGDIEKLIEKEVPKLNLPKGLEAPPGYTIAAKNKKKKQWTNFKKKHN